MACNCLDRHLEDRILVLDVRRDGLPWWAFRRRRELTLRIAALFDVLEAARNAQLPPDVRPR